ncbi:hypothetical protein [Amycolatopsis sp. WGS_07]|uniref:hypothetical protein n=1 Tax=Amycolatopsis sp. WGS_07 TaxID=3076764 RepID=UPI0038735A53
MSRTVYGHPDLDSLLAAAGLDTAGATVRANSADWLVIRLASYWTQHTRADAGRIVFSSMQPVPWLPPTHEHRSGLLDDMALFAVACVDTVEAVGKAVAADPLRNAYFGGEAPDVPVRVDFDVEPPRPTPDGAGTGRTVALMRITAPQHIPARYWPSDMEEGGQETSTSLDFAHVLTSVKAVRAPWQD